MSQSYSALVFSDEGMRQWMKDEGMALPSNWAASRYPTANELNEALTTLTDCRVSHHISLDHWSVSIEATDGVAYRTLLMVEKAPNDEAPDTQLSFWFWGGELQIMIAVLNALSRVCGPLVLLPHSDTSKYVLTPNA